MTTDIESQIRRVADAAFAQTDPVPSPATSISSRRRNSGRWIALAAASLLVFGLVGALVVFGDDRSTPDPVTTDFSETFSARGVLAEVPLLGIDPTEGEVSVAGSDLGLLAEIGDVEQEASDNPLGDLTPYVELTVLDPTVALATSDLLFESLRNPEEVESDFGFGFGDVERFVTASQFLGFTGDDTFEFPFDAFVLRDGVNEFDDRAGEDHIIDVGDGADGEPNFDEQTDLRPIGQPLRIAVDDDRSSISVTRSTPYATGWFDRDAPTLADVPDFAEAASVLDSVDGLYSVFFAAYDRDVDSYDTTSSADVDLGVFTISEPFTTMGVGWSGIGDDQTTTIVYVFADEAAAAASAGPIDDLYAGGELGGDAEATISDVFVVDGVDVEGRTVVVTGMAAPETRADNIDLMLLEFSALTRHR